MAGKRLIDAAKLFNAGRSIGKQHIELRKQQWDVYSRTSGLAKAAKRQTDRVTVTAGAAYEIAKRFSESGPSWQDQPQPQDAQRAREDARSRDTTAEGSIGAAQRSSARADTNENVSENAKSDPGVRSTSDDGSLSSLRKRATWTVSVS